MQDYPPRSSVRVLCLPKEVWIGFVASLMEAYNMAIYSFTAPFLAILLFKNMSPSKALFLSYALVCVGSCFIYPLGAIYYGFLGDKQGRRKICTYSTLGLAVATGLMGLVPLNDSSWICFLCLLGAQNFFSGGEYHGSAVFSLEHARGHRIGLLGGISCLFAVFGLCLANLFASLSAYGEWWVRGCFFFGALGGILSYILKKYSRETPAFAAIPSETLAQVHLALFIKVEACSIAAAVLVLAFFIVGYSFIFIFLPLTSVPSASFDSFKSLLAYGALLIVSGAFADWLGLQRLMSWGVLLFSIAVVPLCYFCRDLLALQLSLTGLACLAIAPIHGWMMQQFNADKRCRGIFISSALAVSLFNGSTVPLCLLLYEQFNSLAICACFPLAIGLGCFTALNLKSNYSDAPLAEV